VIRCGNMERGLRWILVTWILASAGFTQEIPTAKHLPTVTFTCDFPGSNPDHYFISIANDGSASYDSTGKLTARSDGDDPFRMDFKATDETRARVFALAQQADYFVGQVDSGKKLANMGMKTLTYQDEHRSAKATYNYSSRPAVQELTQLLQGVAQTLELGRRLEYEYHYQKLALDEELKEMESESERGRLEELAAVTPILKKIENDTSLVNIARVRAQRMLAKVQSSDSASKPGNRN
jgi:hypothetical protein